MLMQYQFEEIQKLKFVVYDIDNKKHIDDVSKHDLIGQVECTLADIVTAGQQYKRTLREKGEQCGVCVCVWHRILVLPQFPGFCYPKALCVVDPCVT